MAIVSIYPSSADRLYLLGARESTAYGGNLRCTAAARDKIQPPLPEVLKAREQSDA